jgi:hypothetical protein
MKTESRENLRTETLATMEDAFRLLDATNGAIFRATFVKKDGTVRDMVARTGVKKHLAGGVLAYAPRPRGLLPVFDMAAEGYRMVNVATLRELVHAGTRYIAGW